MNRRTLLKGMGAGLFAPLFREAFAQSATPARLVIVMECNGVYPETPHTGILTHPRHY